MIHFEYPYYLFALCSLLVFAGIYLLFIRWRKKALSRMGRLQLIQKNTRTDNVLSHLRFLLLLLAVACIIISLANPQVPASGKNVKHSGIDVAFIVDCSRSMLARDVQPDRFTVARQSVLELLDALPEARVSIISFAQQPSNVLPLTPDHAAAAMILQSLNVDVSQGQGSDIGSAVQQAIQALPTNQNHYKAIVLFSDGEDFGDEMNNAIQQAETEQVAICCVGIGTTKGAEIPDSTGKAFTVKHDDAGNVVITKLHPEILEKLADETGGVAAEFITNPHAINSVLQRLNDINKNLYDDKLVVSYDSVFQFFLLPALFFLVAEFFIGSYRFRFLQKNKG